ncbi:MAG: hypothetical protein ACFC03_03280 [Candidatus Malihini olakiniferum]
MYARIDSKLYDRSDPDQTSTAEKHIFEVIVDRFKVREEFF